MVGDPAQDVGEPGARVDVVQLGGDDERVHGCGAVAATIASREQPRLAPECDAAQRAFGGVVAETDAAIAQEPAERVPASQHVVHRLGDLGVARHFAACPAHPGFELGHERRHVRLPQGEALLSRQAVDGALDVEDGINPPHGFGGERRPRDLGQVKQLATPMSPTPRFRQRPGLAPWMVEVVEPGISVGLQDAGIACQVLVRVLAPAVA